MSVFYIWSRLPILLFW